MDYIKWLSEVSMKNVSTVGGKTASLGEMYGHLKPLGIDVPNGFAITSEGFKYFVQSNKLEPFISEISKLKEINKEELSRHSGAIRAEFEKGKIIGPLREEILQAYQKLVEAEKGPVSFAVRSSATAEDLPQASFAGQQESYLNVHGEEELLDKCVLCFSSLYTDRSLSYRQDKAISENQLSLTICVQKMVRSDLASSGVMFTLDTESGFKDVIVINASWGLGENIVKGVVNPDEYLVHRPTLQAGFKSLIGKKLGSKEFKLIYQEQRESAVKNIPVLDEEQKQFCLSEEEIFQLSRWGEIIEDHYSTSMDIEWAKDGVDGKIYILQARPETVHFDEDNSMLEEITLIKTSKIILTGDSIGSRLGQGKVKIIKGIEDLHTFNEGEILVAEKTEPDWEPFMKKASAIITERGGRTCHAAIVSREMNIPAIVGTKSATSLLKNGDEVTVACMFGREGFVFEGILPFRIKKTQVNKNIKTKTKLMMNIAQPETAFKSSLIPNDGVGLLRMEFIITNTIKIHPMALIKVDQVLDAATKDRIQDMIRGYKSREDYFVENLSRGIAHIAAAFFPKDVIVRFSDFKSDEYRNLIGGKYFERVEENPMIGFRGAGRYYHSEYQEAFALECQAIKKVRDIMGLINVKVMIPFCRTLTEAKNVLVELEKNNIRRGENGIEIYMMCEIPSNALLIEEFSEMFDGFSIGSNDLTQLTLGVDRNSEALANVFSESDPAVMKLIKMAIYGSHQKGRKIGLCGQKPSDDVDYAKFLVTQHIDSISLNPDALMSVRQKVWEMEQEEDLMKKVRDIMTKNPATCLPDATLEFAAKLMLDHDCGEIPIIDNEKDMRPIGVITDRDICCRSIALGKNPLNLLVRDCMSSPVKTIKVDSSVEDCCDLMESSQVRRIPVVDHNGRICGVVSLADIAASADDKKTSEVIKEICRPSLGAAE
jgi:pyruvate,water dikinase